MEECEHDGADDRRKQPVEKSRMRIAAERRRSGSASGSVADIDAHTPANTAIASAGVEFRQSGHDEPYADSHEHAGHQ